MSGRRAAAESASVLFVACPMTVNPGSRWRTDDNPVIKSSWSSTIKTRMEDFSNTCIILPSYSWLQVHSHGQLLPKAAGLSMGVGSPSGRLTFRTQSHGSFPFLLVNRYVRSLGPCYRDFTHIRICGA